MDSHYTGSSKQGTTEKGNENNHINNGILIRPVVSRIISGKFQQTAVLLPGTGILYVKEASVWGI